MKTIKEWLDPNKKPFKEKVKMAWYFQTWFEKLIIVLGFLSLFYSLSRIIIQGIW